MSQNPDDAWLLALGAVVSDGGTVDWDGAERQATRSDQQRLIQQLRRLSVVVDAHRRVTDVPGDEGSAASTGLAPPAAPVTHWRHLVLFDRIGEGAFGSVYRGWDPLLERDVAVKLFDRSPTSASPLDEARHLAKVRHPNVVVVHGADEEGGRAGIWMEYIEGLTLAAIVRERGPMSPREVAGIGLDLCGALSAIHAAGLVHRDIKAQNVMRAVGGRIVLMDLGGAHAVLGAECERFSGTPVYMAPELLHGVPPTAATDVYSLGVLLFFLLCGRLPVEADTLDGVRRAHASGARARLRDVRADLPDALVQVMERATAASPQDRYRTAGELEHALAHAAGAAAPRATTAPGDGSAAHMRVRDVALVSGLVLLALVATLAYGRWWHAPAQAAPLLARFNIGPPYNTGSWPRISPDGRLVVFGAFIEGQQRFWVRPLDTPTGYAAPHGTARESPFWSPDSTTLAFFENAQLKLMPLPGGEPRVLADAPRPQGGDWRGDTILFGRADGIYRVPAAGGPAQQVTVVARAKGEYQHSWPHILPDGRRFLYTVRSTHADESGIYVGSLDGEAPWRLMPAFSRPVYTNGYLLYVREGALLAHPFDPRRAALRGNPVMLAARVEHHAGGDAAFDISTTGVLIYSTSPGLPSTRLVLYDRRGRELEALTDVGWFGRPRFSPDGQRIVAERVEPNANGADLWIYGLNPRSEMRLTRHPAPDVSPVWSPDGRTIVFSSRRASVYDVFSKTVDAVHDERLLFSLPGDKIVEHWSPDGRHLVGTLRRSGLWLVPIDSSDPPVRIRTNETAQSWQAEFSPDGRWLAYMSTESGKPEVYVEPFPVTGARWQVSTHGGAEPHWRSDGRELLYLDADGMLTSVTVPDGPWDPSAPQPLFRVAVTDIAGANDYTVSPDGRLLVVNTFVSDPLVPPVEVIVNWRQLLER